MFRSAALILALVVVVAPCAAQTAQAPAGKADSAVVDSVDLHLKHAAVQEDDELWAPGLAAAAMLSSLIAATAIAATAKGCDSTLDHIGCGLFGFVVGGYAIGEAVGTLWPRKHHSPEAELRFRIKPDGTSSASLGLAVHF